MKINKNIFLILVIGSVFNYSSSTELKKSVEASTFVQVVPGTQIEAETKFKCDQMDNLNDKMAKYLNHKEFDKKFAHDQNVETFKKLFLPFNVFMDNALFNENFGYYCHNVKIGLNDEKQFHFETFPHLMSPNFGRMIAYQAYAMWLSMIYSQDIKEDEAFTIAEFGAGEGILAHDILDGIRFYASRENNDDKTNWRKFYQVVQYVIGEKSPKLINSQSIKNKEFIDNNKLIIKPVDAKDIKNFGKKIKGLVLSNELPDAFPVHKVKQTKDNKVKACVLVPHIKKSYVENQDPSIKKVIIDADQQYRSLIEKILNDKETKEIYDQTDCNIVHELKEIREDSYIIDAQTWLALRRDKSVTFNLASESLKAQAKSEIDLLNQSVFFKEIYIDHEYFPELRTYIARHQNVINHHNKVKAKDYAFLKAREILKTNYNCDIPVQNVWYINYDTENYLKSISEILESGFVLTIDYGANCNIHKMQLDFPSQALRFYPVSSGSVISYFTRKHIYDKVGFTDLTTDTNFADMALIGTQLGFQTIFYGDQGNLDLAPYSITNKMHLVPFDLSNDNFAAGPDENRYFNSLQEDGFKMLVQRRTSNRNAFKVLRQSEDLFPDIIEEINNLPTPSFVYKQFFISGLKGEKELINLLNLFYDESQVKTILSQQKKFKREKRTKYESKSNS